MRFLLIGLLVLLGGCGAPTVTEAPPSVPHSVPVLATTTPAPTTTLVPTSAPTTAPRVVVPTSTAKPVSTPRAVPTSTSKPKPAVTPKPTPKPQAVVQKPAPAPRVSFRNCTDVRNAGAAPIRRGDPGFQSKFDADGDGVGCE